MGTSFFSISPNLFPNVSDLRLTSTIGVGVTGNSSVVVPSSSPLTWFASVDFGLAKCNWFVRSSPSRECCVIDNVDFLEECVLSPSLSSSVVLGENCVQLSVISIILKLLSMLFSALRAESSAVIFEFSSRTHESTVSNLAYLSLISYHCPSVVCFDTLAFSALERSNSPSTASLVSIASDNSISSLAFSLSSFFLASSIEFFSSRRSCIFCWSSSFSSSFRICSFKTASFCVCNIATFALSDSHSLNNETISLFMDSCCSSSEPISCWFFSWSSERCCNSDFRLEIVHSNSRLDLKLKDSSSPPSGRSSSRCTSFWGGLTVNSSFLEPSSGSLIISWLFSPFLRVCSPSPSESLLVFKFSFVVWTSLFTALCSWYDDVSIGIICSYTEGSTSSFVVIGEVFCWFSSSGVLWSFGESFSKSSKHRFSPVLLSLLIVAVSSSWVIIIIGIGSPWKRLLSIRVLLISDELSSCASLSPALFDLLLSLRTSLDCGKTLWLLMSWYCWQATAFPDSFTSVAAVISLGPSSSRLTKISMVE